MTLRKDSDSTDVDKEQPTPWTIALSLETQLKRRFRRAYGEQHVEELWSEVVIHRAPHVFKAWDESKGGSQVAHFRRSMLWYAYKYMKRKARTAHRDIDTLPEQQLACGSKSHYSDSAVDTHELHDILSGTGLTEFEYWLVVQRIELEHTFVDIAEVLDVTPTTVGRWFRDVLNKLRERLSSDEHDPG